MRVVVDEFMSLDGVAQAPGAHEDMTAASPTAAGRVPYFDPR